MVLLGAAAFSILVSVAIVASLISEAVGFLRTDPSLVDFGWFPRRGAFDVWTLVVGSLLVTAIAMLVALPIGLGAAIYLSEYARPRVRRILKPILEVLAGIPSVVLGFFALAVISPSVVTRLNGDANQFNLAAAGIGVGLLVIPLVASISEDALRAVPAALREASYGMGAKKLTTVVTVVLPAAISGLVAAFIVAVSRALGETMVVAIATGASGGTERTYDIFQPGQTMTAAMTSLATGSDAVRGASNAFQSLFFVGMLLFLLTLTLNLLADFAVQRLRQRY
jgi:phosphate transport system permease protein